MCRVHHFSLLESRAVQRRKSGDLPTLSGALSGGRNLPAPRIIRGEWPLVLWQPFARRVLGRMLRRCTASTPVSSSFEWHNFVDRSSLFTNNFRRHRVIVSAKQKRSAACSPEAYFMCEPAGSPLILLAVLPCCAHAPVSVFLYP